MAAGGSILVENDGGFVARFSVQYQEEGRTITSDSGNFTLGTSKAIRIPPGATDIFVKLEEEYFIDAWSTVCTFSFDSPVTKCYELRGTTLNARCNEKPCPGSGAAAAETAALSRRQLVALAAPHQAGKASDPALCRPPNFPAGIPLAPELFENWSLHLNVPNLWTAVVHDAQQVVALANWAREQGYKLRPRGQSHNWSPLVVPDGTDPCGKVLLVDTTHLKGQATFQLKNGLPTATFGTGTTVEEATLFLQSLDNQGSGAAPGYTFQNMTAPGNLTLGGVLAVGAHGTGVPGQVAEPNLNGCMSNLVVSFKAVVTDPAGASPDEYVLKEFQRDDPDASAFLVHLGRAFLTEVTLRVIPNYYLQVTNWYPNTDVLFEPPSSSPSKQALATLLDDYGRVEVIWFPFTTEPWVKTWQLVDKKIEPQVPGPYNYPWANNISLTEFNLIKYGLFTFPGPGSTRAFGLGQLAAAKLNAPAGQTMNGTARDLLLYVKDTTLRVTAFGYALQIRRDQVQEVANTFYRKYETLLTSYANNDMYPVNGPVELRFTTVDLVDDLGVPGATPPALSVCHSIDPADQALDTVFWIDSLTIPGTKHADEFYDELEAWFKSQWGTPQNNIMRPEWSKGWGYTKTNGVWSSRTILTKAIPAHYNQSGDKPETFDWAQQTLAAYDKHHIYTNSFLDVLLPG